MRRLFLGLLVAIPVLQAGCSWGKRDDALSLPSQVAVATVGARSSEILTPGTGKVVFEIRGDESFVRDQGLQRMAWIEVRSEDGLVLKRNVAGLTDPTANSPLLEIELVMENGRRLLRGKGLPVDGFPVEQGKRYTLAARVSYFGKGHRSRDLVSAPHRIAIQ